jgi:hypothetical protein
MALFKRILETRGVFIPQTFTLLNGWCSRDRSGYLWSTLEYQVRYSSYKTLEEAREALITKIHKA